MSVFGSRPRYGPPFAFRIFFLVYLIFPVSALVKQPWDQMTAGLLLLGLFAIVYVLGFGETRGKLAFVLALTAIVGYFAYRYDENFIYLAFYATPIVAMLNSIRKTAAAYAGLFALFLMVGWRYHLFTDVDELLQLLPAMLVISLMPIAIRVGRRSRELRDKLSLANEEIARLSKNEERQRISRDLHDTLGHTLSLITLKSELAEKLIVKNPQRAAQEIRDVQLTSRAALKQVRELVADLNAVTVRDEIAQAKIILTSAGIELRHEGGSDREWPSPSPLIDNMLGMCLREAVTNVVKHSRARNCAVGWTETPDAYELWIEDDGAGTYRAANTVDDGKNGLKGMRERLKLVEGKMEMRSEPGRGTRIDIRVPRVAKSAGQERSNR
ncbi:sensor histidine kinase [Cohnella sp. CFH 77786]|uniref:sensor histidine kinase n=1 Tax=Cohnella sp. CFH 77786 TaxID=2662265 RepID=UPI001C60BE48|nr:sensor histidine kinase [Cohnella sp. CFH 77786]MBW5446574.1 sensor histidine kinase [Cohnella sp. CFH 77786]